MKTDSRTPSRPRRPRTACHWRDPHVLPAIYQVVVECRSERDQEAVYRRLKAEGRKCRVLTL